MSPFKALLIFRRVQDRGGRGKWEEKKEGGKGAWTEREEERYNRRTKGNGTGKGNRNNSYADENEALNNIHEKEYLLKDDIDTDSATPKQVCRAVSSIRNKIKMVEHVF